MDMRMLRKDITCALRYKLALVTESLIEQAFRADPHLIFSVLFNTASEEEILFLGKCITHTEIGTDVENLLKMIVWLSDKGRLNVAVQLLDTHWSNLQQFIDRYRLMNLGMKKNDATYLERLYLKMRRRHSI